MPVTYTNRKGVTYYLCRGINKSGKPYYYFAREAKGEAVEAIPEGFKINESPNGFVTLAKDRPMQITPEEIAAVEAAVGRHPKAHNYRVSAKHKRIEVHERVGPDPDELISQLRQVGLLVPGQTGRLREQQERRARFSPVLRFILSNAERRTFRVQRRRYSGGVDNWAEIGTPAPVAELARELIPKLGTERFFELY
jgi:hypothetical protein